MKIKKYMPLTINVYDLVGREYKVYDNSYNENLTTHKWENLYDSNKTFTICSIPFNEAVKDINGKDKIEKFILISDKEDRVYRVLFLDKGVQLFS